MSDEDTLIMRPEITGDPVLTMLVRAVFVLGMFVGALLFALGLFVGVLV